MDYNLDNFNNDQFWSDILFSDTGIRDNLESVDY